MRKKAYIPLRPYIKKGDTVKVLSGNDRNKKGKVLKVFPKNYKAIVEGMRLAYKHTKPSAKNPQGGIVKQETPIHISNLMLVDPATGQATRIGRKPDEHGKMQRYSKNTGELIKNG